MPKKKKTKKKVVKKAAKRVNRKTPAKKPVPKKGKAVKKPLTGEIDYSRKLQNTKHERFSQEYITALNVTDSYKAAYPKSSTKAAEANGSRLISNDKVAGRIEYLQNLVGDKCELKAEDIIRELMKIGFSNIKSLTGPSNIPLDISTLPDKTTAAIQSIKTTVTTTTNENGTVSETVKTKIMCHSKLGALTKLGMHKGIFQKDNEQKNETLAKFLAKFKE